MVAEAFGVGDLDEAPTVHPDAPVSDFPGLDGHRRTWPPPRCEFPADVAHDRVFGVFPGLDPRLQKLGVCCFVPDHEPPVGRKIACRNRDRDRVM